MRKIIENLALDSLILVIVVALLGLVYLSGREVVQSITMISEGTLVIPDDTLGGPGNSGAVFKRAAAKALLMMGVSEKTTLAWIQGIYAVFMAFVTLILLLWPVSFLVGLAKKKRN